MIELQMHLLETIFSHCSCQVSSLLFYMFKCSTIKADSVEDYSDVIILNLNRENTEPMKL